MKLTILKIFVAPFAAYMITLPVIVILHTIMGRDWIRDTLNNSAFSVWIVLTGVLIVFTITQHFLKFKKHSSV
jgi:hypothetical protein